MENTNLQKSLNFNDTEMKDWISGICRILVEEFKSKLAKDEIYFQEAVKQSVILYTSRQQNMASQLLQGPSTGGGISYKINILSDLLVDKIYDSLKKN